MSCCVFTSRSRIDSPQLMSLPGHGSSRNTPSASPCPSPSSHRRVDGTPPPHDLEIGNISISLGTGQSSQDHEYEMRGGGGRGAGVTARPTTAVSGDDDYEFPEDHDDTISDISFDEDNYYNRDEIIVANRTASFNVTKTNFQYPQQHHQHQSLSQDSSRILTASPSLSRQISNTDMAPLVLGTIRGVLLPCLQTSMFGAILFLRLPWLISQLGLYLTLVAMILAVGCAICTLLSILAIATNGKMKKSAGVYVLVKKCLGLELGGCIGVFHLIQKVGVTAMYCLAAAETALAAVEFNDVFANKTTVFAIILCAILSVLSMFPQYHKRFEDITLGLSILTVVSFIFGTLLFVTGVWSSGISSDDREFAGCVLPHSDPGSDPRKGSEAIISTSFAKLVSILFVSVSGVIGASTRSGNFSSSDHLLTIVVRIPFGTTQ